MAARAQLPARRDLDQALWRRNCEPRSRTSDTRGPPQSSSARRRPVERNTAKKLRLEVLDGRTSVATDEMRNKTSGFP